MTTLECVQRLLIQYLFTIEMKRKQTILTASIQSSSNDSYKVAQKTQPLLNGLHEDSK